MRRKREASPFEVRIHSIDGVTVKTIEYRHEPDQKFVPPPWVKGAVVRIVPDPGIDPDRLELARQLLLNAGALAVKVERANLAAAPRQEESLAEAPAPARTLREVALAAAEKSSSPRKDELIALLEEALSKAGL